MISVVVLGTGNVSQNLFNALLNTDEINVVQVFGRRNSKLDFFREQSQVTTSLDALLEADVYVLAVSDDAITEVAQKLKHVQGIIAHTSGAISLKALLPNKRTGVFYPLQTFTARKLLNFRDIPLCLEASSSTDLDVLKKIAYSLSNQVAVIDSERRKILHLAAVFSNNFSNYMFAISEQICHQNNLDFSLLNPLIKETVQKLDVLTPKTAQTGPARRGDQKTLHAHLQLLEENQHREIYTLLSNAIKVSYGKEL